MIQFPKDFLWGAATSAHQVEGNNIHNDWWEWEQKKAIAVPSGQACRHYHRYKEDFALARQLHHNCHRLSIEWSRIQPREGSFIDEELNHYREVILALRAVGIEPVVTLHHFTNPAWLGARGGWLHKKAVDHFLRYVETVVELLADTVRFWVTINEPLVYVYHSYLIGAWPPQESSFFKGQKVCDALSCAHCEAYGRIHAIYRNKGLAAPCVSIAKNVQEFVPCRNTLLNKAAVALRHRVYNLDLIGQLASRKTLDFIGLNYYTRDLIDVTSLRFRHMFLEKCPPSHSRLEKNSLGWDIYPEGLYSLLKQFKRFGVPLFVLENGICTDNDEQRWEFIRAHLGSLHRAMAEGVDVKGYLYWSLIDNFEWDKGFAPRFGLVGVDYETYTRTIRPSGVKFAEVCKTGVLA